MSSNEDEITALTPRMASVSPEYAEILMLGNVLQRSGYFVDVRDQAQAVTKILYGRELGISPIVSMGAIHIIEGKPALSANLLAALIKRSGRYDYRVKEWDDNHCVLMFRQKVGDKWEEVGESSFSIADAQRAKVKFKSANGHDASWTKFPKAMLFARALSQGERTYCPDVSACALYVPEELGADVNEDGDVTQLPPSAGAVPVTTAPISVAPPKRAAVVLVQPNIKGAPEPQKAADGPEVVADAPAFSVPAFMESLADKTPPADTGAIDLPRQKALHRAFKDAIRSEDAKKHADVFLQDWLRHQGYFTTDDKGNQKGTTKTIPMMLFEEVKKAATKYAESLT